MNPARLWGLWDRALTIPASLRWPLEGDDPREPDGGGDDGGGGKEPAGGTGRPVLATWLLDVAAHSCGALLRASPAPAAPALPPAPLPTECHTHGESGAVGKGRAGGEKMGLNMAVESTLKSSVSGLTACGPESACGAGFMSQEELELGEVRA